MSLRRFAWSLVGTNLRASLALRGTFLLQALFMALNNAIFFVTWLIFFDRYEQVRGWRLADLAALQGILFAGGMRDLARQIHEGELDALLTQPKSVLLQALGSRTSPSGWGDMASGAIFLALCGLVGWRDAPLAVLAIALSATTLLASAVIVHSGAFWLGGMDGLARQVCEVLITFSAYPEPIFGGALRLVLFTVLPAGFVTVLPVELIRDFRPAVLAAALAGAFGYAALALWVFERGLRRYESGSRFGIRG